MSAKLDWEKARRPPLRQIDFELGRHRDPKIAEQHDERRRTARRFVEGFRGSHPFINKMRELAKRDSDWLPSHAQAKTILTIRLELSEQKREHGASLALVECTADQQRAYERLLTYGGKDPRYKGMSTRAKNDPSWRPAPATAREVLARLGNGRRRPRRGPRRGPSVQSRAN